MPECASSPPLRGSAQHDTVSMDLHKVRNIGIIAHPPSLLRSYGGQASMLFPINIWI